MFQLPVWSNSINNASFQVNRSCGLGLKSGFLAFGFTVNSLNWLKTGSALTNIRHIQHLPDVLKPIHPSRMDQFFYKSGFTIILPKLLMTCK